jgi:hypothetical protein
MIDKILISLRIKETWENYCQLSVKDLLKKYPDLMVHEVPDEDVRIVDGVLQIFIKIRATEIKMNVPSDEWEYV